MKTVNTKTPIQSLAIKTLTLAVGAVLSATVAHAADKKPIGDLEIYQMAGGGGNATIMMMLDISGSMLGCDEPVHKEAEAGGSADYTAIQNYEVLATDRTKMATIRVVSGYCAPLSNGERINPEYLDRMGRLKHALIELLRDPNNLSPKTKLGFGVFPYAGPRNNQLRIPAKPLTDEHRLALIKFVADLQAGGGTPSAHAYAEVGAYMMGTKTANVTDTSEKAIYYPRFMATFNENNTSTWFLKRITFVTEGADIVPGWRAYGTISPIKIPVPQPSDWITNPTFNYNPILDRDLKNLNPNYFANVTHATTAGTRYKSARALTLVNGKVTDSVDPTTDGAVYFGVQDKYTQTDNEIASFQWANASTKKPDGLTYQSPVSGECGAYGIYFLTDGAPNAQTDADKIMLMALNKTGSSMTISSPFLPDVGAHYQRGNWPLTVRDRNGHTITLEHDSGWQQIGEFAKKLRDKSNPSGQEIKTATLGFGYDFTSAGSGSDCEALTTVDAKNLCKWGSPKYDFGQGGFLATSSPTAITKNIKDFAVSLNKKEVPPAPTGVITVPDDPYGISDKQATAYLPVMEANVGSSLSVWPGNLKKYSLKAGTVYGENGKRLYGSGGVIESNVKDQWSRVETENEKVTVGGFYAQLTSPNTGRANVRTVYVEDIVGGKPALRKFGVNASGQITLDGNPYSTSNKFNDTDTYTDTNIKYLLRFLGFDNATVDAITNFATATLTQPTVAIRVLGASPHSAATALSYQAKVDVTRRYPNKDLQNYVLFGSMDGALHLADDKDGKEQFAFIPKVMLKNQAKALENGSKGAVQEGQPFFGIDAPWLVAADYDYEKKNPSNPDDLSIKTEELEEEHEIDGARKRVKVIRSTMKPADDIYAYGGFRMGGNGLYGLNLGKKSGTVPSLAFALTPSVAGFERMGQIWARPTKATILKDGTATDVLIFGGGYDLCYENENFQVGLAGQIYAIANDQNGAVCASKTSAIGNAVYMVNANTGALIWSASSTTGSTQHSDMKHSIVAGVNAIDRNGDGYVDAIYFADLGGQIFRADATSANNGIPNRVTRLLKDDAAGTKFVRRFYEKPVLSVYSNSDTNNGDRFVLVNAISGDRSNPLSKMRENNAYADRVYGVIDTDIGKGDSQFYNSFSASIKDFDGGTLENLSGTTEANKTTKIASVKAKKGWYYPLTYFDGYTNVKYTKGVGKSEVISSLLYTSLYNPDKNYNKGDNSCSAAVVGGSEYQMYCLPFGVCESKSSKNGRGGFLPAGQGISELTLGPLDSSVSGSKKQVLISSVQVDDTLKIKTNTESRTGYGEGAKGSSIKGDPTVTADGGDGYMPTVIFEQRFVFQPLRWYDNSIKSN